MPKRSPNPHQQLLDLLTQVLAVARTLAPTDGPMPPRGPSGTRGRPGMVGIHPHQSKYNPWRAYIWDTRTRRQVYLGAFPSIAKARAAQKAYRNGEPVRNGTKAGPRLVSTRAVA